ncbi:MAG: AAA family ATPase [Bacteroidales bacterium]|nr:AAA family ATPase [Bacteroidales bacterium]MCF8327963.1 AAA family ATPase [Bacteroidales bacterium]
MQELFSYQNNLLRLTDTQWHRYLYPELKKKTRLLGLKGLRGVGKTTMLLQYLADDCPEPDKALYVTADHPYFYTNSLFDLASQWHSYGGKFLLIDEVHKYALWAQELKLIYDGYPDMQVYFTGSSALDLYKGEADLSRRLETKTLQGLSFREYLSLNHNLHFERLTLEEIFTHHTEIAKKMLSGIKILPLFKTYLEKGYFPFAKEIPEGALSSRLLQVINAVLENDLAYIKGYSASNVEKVKRLLGVIAQSVPFEPNIAKIVDRLHISRSSVYSYLKNLKDAQILYYLYKPGKGLSKLQKPGKIYFENTSFLFAFQDNPDMGTLRETFFMNQLKNAGHQINLSPEKGDFVIDEKFTIEIGGRNKKDKQIQGIENSYLAIDDIEFGFDRKIPLWMFGFLY